MASPLVSVITVTLNAEAHVAQALRSVEEQDYPHIQHIIIDGQSTDATLRIIGQHSGRVSDLVSEKDSGIFQAMNKGVARAQGELIYFLNADDRFADPRVVTDAVAAFDAAPAPHIVYGELHWQLGGRQVRSVQPPTPTRNWFARRTILHQTVFVRAELFRRIGAFREDVKVVADYDWLLRAFLDPGIAWRHLDRDIAVMGTGGASWNPGWERERLRVMRQYFAWHEILFQRIVPHGLARLRKGLR